MPNTYSQIYIQVVFAVEGRQNLISPHNREVLHKYITGIVADRNQKMLSIFCMPDHAHLLLGIKPSIAISDLVRDIKAGSCNFLTPRNGFAVNSGGRRDLAPSPTREARSDAFRNISLNKKSIINISRLKANTQAC